MFGDILLKDNLKSNTLEAEHTQIEGGIMTLNIGEILKN